MENYYREMDYFSLTRNEKLNITLPIFVGILSVC